jgi:hypothetical protein
VARGDQQFDLRRFLQQARLLAHLLAGQLGRILIQQLFDLRLQKSARLL